ncbi:MAG TPA: MFS transporter, partial [Burkholderiales bacterium]|nr:MFS transporter [Burkholderiales bacterium]
MIQETLVRLGRMHQFAALRHCGFRLLWMATLLSSTARWADMVVVGWLTLELTDSPLMVGIVAGSKMAGYIAAPFMGVIADRMDKRLLLIIAAVVNLAVTGIMLLLFVSDWLALWHVIALALVSGLTWALDNPARQALVPDLVEKEDLTNAIALNAVAVEITVVIGPALGGLLIPVLGMGGAYGLITGIFLMDVVVLLRMKVAKQSTQQVHESPGRSLIGGLKYVWGNQTVLVLLLVAFLLNLLAAPYRYSFLPLFARYILDAGPTGYGMLTAMAGFGALVAGLWVVSKGNVKSKGRLLVWSSLVWPVALLLFALSTSYYLSLAFVFVAGLAQAIAWTVIATLILSNTTHAMRGRVMGLRTGVVIALPFGNFLAGAAAERFGAPAAQGVYGASAILIMLAIVLLVPSLRRLE